MRSDPCVPYADYIVIDNWRKKKRRRSGENGALSHPLLFPDCRAFPQKAGSEHDVWSIHKIFLICTHEALGQYRKPHNCQKISPRQFIQSGLVRCRVPDEVACYYDF